MKKRKSTSKSRDRDHLVERVQTGIRIEKRLLKVLKGLAEVVTSKKVKTNVTTAFAG